MESNSNAGANTILLIIIMVALVAGGVWYFSRTAGPAATPDQGTNINVTLPNGDSGGGAENQ